MDATRTPRALAQDVAVLVSGTVRAVVDHPPGDWRTDGLPYVTVRNVLVASGIRGDDVTVAYATGVQVDLWERRGTEDPARLASVLAALLDTKVAPYGRPRFEQATRVPDEDADVIHHAIDLRYHSSR